MRTPRRPAPSLPAPAQTRRRIIRTRHALDKDQRPANEIPGKSLALCITPKDIAYLHLRNALHCIFAIHFFLDSGSKRRLHCIFRVLSPNTLRPFNQFFPLFGMASALKGVLQ
jgi:hypothetical protein